MTDGLSDPLADVQPPVSSGRRESNQRDLGRSKRRVQEFVAVLSCGSIM